jgi:hypothetical protein
MEWSRIARKSSGGASAISADTSIDAKNPTMAHLYGLAKTHARSSACRSILGPETASESPGNIM